MSLELRCADLGLACSGVVKAESKEELLGKVAEHAETKHGVQLNDTLVDYAVTRVRDTGSRA